MLPPSPLAPFGRGDIPRRVPGCQEAVVGQELLLLDTVDERLHVLSASAGLIYTSIDGAASVGQIVGALSADLDVDESVLERDVMNALGDFVAEGLVDIGHVGDAERCPENGAVASTRAGRSRSVMAVERTTRWDRARKRRLDAVGPWPIELGPFLAGAAVVVVRLSDPAVAALLTGALDLLPPSPRGAVVDEHLSVVRDRRRPGRWRVYLGGSEVAKPSTAAGAAESVLAGCNRAATQHPAGAIRFHGGVVERDGLAVVICGVSGAGKSTLTAALVRDGWRYLSDEVAIVDPQTLMVTPYPKWIDLGPDALERAGLDQAQGVGPRGAKHHIPSSLVGTVGQPARLAVLVMLSAPDDDRMRQPAPIAGVDAVQMALGDVFATSWDTPGGLQALVDLCSRASVVTMGRAPLDEMTGHVANLWDEHRRPVELV